jgi:4-oxalocrotonate tautomerase
MPIVTVAMYEGRTLDQKREIVKGITDVVARVTGNTPESVHVVIDEVKRENWAIGGLLQPDRVAAGAVRPAATAPAGTPARPVKIERTAIPPLELVPGMNTQYNVCQETVGSGVLRMGVCNHAPDMADLKWTGKAEEAFYVARGSIRVRWEGDGEKGEALVREGETIFLPRGLDYALQATGEPAVNVFAIAGGSTSLGAVHGREAGEKLRSAAARIQ